MAAAENEGKKRAALTELEEKEGDIFPFLLPPMLIFFFLLPYSHSRFLSSYPPSLPLPSPQLGSRKWEKRKETLESREKKKRNIGSISRTDGGRKRSNCTISLIEVRSPCWDKGAKEEKKKRVEARARLDACQLFYLPYPLFPLYSYFFPSPPSLFFPGFSFGDDYWRWRKKIWRGRGIFSTSFVPLIYPSRGGPAGGGFQKLRGV